MDRVPKALTIAGSDSGGGAGIQADLKTFAALGVHGMSVLTAITAQNTREVKAVQDVEVDVIRAQFRAVVEDIGVDAAKTGMLHTSEIIKAVSDELRKQGFPLVVDPVMVAKSGARLLKEDAVRSLREDLLPLATVVTPNAMEAGAIAGTDVKSVSDAERVAKEISEMGPKAVVVKGGHLKGSERAVDVLYYDGDLIRYEAERLDVNTTHGTGCVFASAIAAELSKGKGVKEAVAAAKDLVTYAIMFGLNVGSGHGPVNPTAILLNEAEKYRVLEEVKEGARMLESEPKVSRLIPESQTNLAMGLPYSKGPEDVAAIPGRIVSLGDRVKASSCPEFGASRHVARALVTLMGLDSSVRAAINVRYSEELVKLCESMGMLVSSYDRREEPLEVKAKEGATIPWGVRRAYERVGRVPEVIYHTGDYGKEPMVLVLGRSATEVAKKVVELAKRLP